MVHAPQCCARVGPESHLGESFLQPITRRRPDAVEEWVQAQRVLQSQRPHGGAAGRVFIPCSPSSRTSASFFKLELTHYPCTLENKGGQFFFCLVVGQKGVLRRTPPLRNEFQQGCSGLGRRGHHGIGGCRLLCSIFSPCEIQPFSILPYLGPGPTRNPRGMAAERVCVRLLRIQRMRATPPAIDPVTVLHHP